MNQKVLNDENSQTMSTWTEQLAYYIRHNDVPLMEACRKVLKEFEEELIVCEDWIEIFDVLGLNKRYSC
jgi:hypothetical protein